MLLIIHFYQIVDVHSYQFFLYLKAIKIHPKIVTIMIFVVTAFRT